MHVHRFITATFVSIAFFAAIGLSAKLYAQTVKFVEISFPILNGKMKLAGIISQPVNVRPDAPILVLVSPPESINRDYHGLFSTLSDSLNQYGFVTFRYDNRNFSDTLSSLPDDERYTLHDGADDLHDALRFLKNDARFSKRPVGLIGHSEGGSIAIVETSRNTDIQFLILLATTGVSGDKMGYSQFIDKLQPALDKIPPMEGNLLKYANYYPLHIFATHTDNATAFSRLREGYGCFYDKYHKDYPHFFGTQSREEMVEHFINPWKKQMRTIAFIRYNPAAYFPTIQCPVFIASAKFDNLLRYEENKEALERLLMENGNLNFRSITVDSVNHNFEDQKFMLPAYVSVHQRKNSTPHFGKGFSYLLRNMTEWIRKRQTDEDQEK